MKSQQVHTFDIKINLLSLKCHLETTNIDVVTLEEHMEATDDSDRWGDSIVFSVTDKTLKKIPRILSENIEESRLEGLKISDNSVLTSETMIIFPQENESLVSEPVQGEYKLTKIFTL